MTEKAIVMVASDSARKGLIKYMRKAFHMLPKLDRPCILDVGCGSGVPTIELARLSNGQIIGLDIEQDLLDRLNRKAEEAGLSERVKTIKRSMFDIDFPDESFDIIWAEGSISIIGFERGLKEWYRFLKPDGFLVAHDEVGNITEKTEKISSLGYDLLDYFVLGEETWWNEYYAPLEKLIHKIRTKHADNPKAIALLDTEQREIEMAKQDPRQYRSVYFVMKKR